MVHAGMLRMQPLGWQLHAARQQPDPVHQHINCPPPPQPGLPSVTLGRTLYESVLRELLLDGGQHSVELWDGYGSNWKVVK